VIPIYEQIESIFFPIGFIQSAITSAYFAGSVLITLALAGFLCWRFNK